MAMGARARQEILPAESRNQPGIDFLCQWYELIASKKLDACLDRCDRQKLFARGPMLVSV
jgi:hypothetical protein